MGYRWVGELLKCSVQHHVLSSEVIRATWEGTRAAVKKDVALVTAFEGGTAVQENRAKKPVLLTVREEGYHFK